MTSRLLREAIAGQGWVLLGAVLLLAGWQAAEALVPVLVGVIIDRAIATGDATALAGWLVVLAALFTALMMGFRFSARLTVAAVVLLSASVQLSLVVLIGLPPVLLALNLLTRPLERRSTAEQEQAARATAVASDLVGGLRVLKGLRAERAATARYRDASRASLAARLRATTLLAVHSAATLAVTSAFLALVALVGGRLAAPSTLPNPAAGALRLSGLSHGALRDVDLEIAPGELVGVVALEPAVAVALLDCLARETDPEAGTIELDGMALRDLDLDAARKALLVAAHDTDLFEDTLIANVATTGRVVMLLDGTVAGQGTHAGLAGSSPAYREAVLA